MKMDVARWIIVLPFVAALAACASGGSKVVADVAPAPAAAVSAEADADARIGSYRLVVRMGEEYYCKRVGVTGSRLSSREICMTRDEMQMSLEESQLLLREMQDAGARNGLNMGQ